MAKFIVKFDLQPLQISLTDRPKSTSIDPQTGLITIDEGDGPDRIRNAVVQPTQRPLIVIRKGQQANGIEIMTRSQTFFVGETTDFNMAQTWVTKANALIGQIVAALPPPPAAPASPAAGSDQPEKNSSEQANTAENSNKARGEHRPFKKGMQLNRGPKGQGAGGDSEENQSENQQVDRKQVTAPVKFEYGRSKPSKRELDGLIEAELTASLAGLDVEKDLSSKSETVAQTPGTPGEKRKKAKVVKVHGSDVFVEVPGGRGQGLIPIDQFEGKKPEIGEEIDVAGERYDGANGLMIYSKLGAAQKVADWSGIQKGLVVEVRVTGSNKGGLEIELGGIRGFLPFSQIDIVRVEQPELLVNSKVKCMIMEVKPQEKNLVVSRRMLIEKEREAMSVEFWAGLEEGQIKTGPIKSVRPFGAFVDLGGADGLIPMGELSWSRINDANEVVKVGQTVEVRVLKVDRDNRKVSLSLKSQHQNPWDDFAIRSRPGTKMKGKVTRITDFGAFIEVEPGIEGLVHVSELSTQRVRRVRDALTEGQEVDVQVLQIDPIQRKLGLSLKAIAMAAENAAQAEEQAQFAAKVAEEKEDRIAADERLANRKKNPNLRGGMGAAGPLFQLPG